MSSLGQLALDLSEPQLNLALLSFLEVAVARKVEQLGGNFELPRGERINRQ